MLCQLNHRADTDADLLRDVVEANVDDRSFWLRKAIGWALREHAKTDPEWVRAEVDRLGDRLSGLSRREATEHLAGLVTGASAPSSTSGAKVSTPSSGAGTASRASSAASAPARRTLRPDLVLQKRCSCSCSDRSPLGGLLLEGVQQAELALARDHVDHRVGAERADQLVLQVAVADEEAQPFQVVPPADVVAGAPQGTREEADLAAVAQPGHDDVRPAGVRRAGAGRSW